MQANDEIIIAVFEFENLSEEQIGIFSRSFSADLITELSRFRQFQVISFSQQFSHSFTGDKKLEGITSDYSIQGSFRCTGDVVRVNVQLYESRMNRLVWGNRFEGMLATLGDIQETLLTDLVGVLQQQINYDLLSQRKKRQAVSFSAYEHWLHGMEELKKGSLEHDEKAREHFFKALEIQPDYALACSGISLSYFNEWSCQLWDRWEISKTGAYEWAQKAIELDDQNYIAALVLGRYFLYQGSWETAEYYLRRSLALNSNDSDTVLQVAIWFVYLGLHQEALALYERSLQLSPMKKSADMTLGAFLNFELGDFEKAASLIVPGTSGRWADMDAFYAAIHYHLGNTAEMQFFWNRFLDSFYNKIHHGRTHTEAEAVKWLIEINPYRGQTNLKNFLSNISSESFIQVTRDTHSESTTRSMNLFLREGAAWKFAYEGVVVLMPDVKGYYDIQKMLAQPGQSFHCTELMGTTLDASGEKLLDNKAKQQYRARLLELQEEIQTAEQFNDYGRFEQLQSEYDSLIDHLSQSLGRKGKSREINSSVEKARSAVTWRIRNAIAKIEVEHPVLGAHLSNTISTGTFCLYKPEKALDWMLN